MQNARNAQRPDSLHALRSLRSTVVITVQRNARGQQGGFDRRVQKRTAAPRDKL